MSKTTNKLGKPIAVIGGKSNPCIVPENSIANPNQQFVVSSNGRIIYDSRA